MQARRRAQPSGTNSPSSSHPRSKHRARCAIFRPCPPCGRQGRPGQGFLAGSNIRAAGERPPRARPQRRGSPGPIPNPAVKPAFAESTAARGCGRAGRRARGGRFSICARGGVAAPGEARRGCCPADLSVFRARTASGPCAFAAPSAAHRRRALAASPGMPSKGPCARGLVRRRTAVHHAPVGPQRGCSLAGPSSVLGRSRRRGRRYVLCRRPFAPRGPLLGRFCSQHASEVLCGPPRGLSCVNGGLTI